jgi:hypothetical protein
MYIYIYVYIHRMQRVYGDGLEKCAALTLVRSYVHADSYMYM